MDTGKVVEILTLLLIVLLVAFFLHALKVESKEQVQQPVSDIVVAGDSS